MTTSIQKWGNSQGIRIPKSILDTINWSENEEIILLIKNEKIILEKAKNRKNIKDLFKDYNGNYKPTEIDWGEPVGDEIW